MIRLLLFSLSILLFFSGCGGEAKPEKNSIEALRAKMEAAHEERFSRDGSASRAHMQQQADRRSANDPQAYVYNDEVLTYTEEKEWIQQGIDNQEYVKWAKLGVGPQEANGWKDLNISDAAIEVFHQQKYTPQKASKFMQKKFFTRPDFYAQFGTPVYNFDSICEAVVKRQRPPFAFLEERCLPYMKESHKNEAIGHLLDEAKIFKGPLALEYLAELRRLAADNSKIQSGMEVTIEEFMEDEDTENFVFLFPLLRTEPTRAEMTFIDENKLPLEDSERFFSFQNPEYWIHKAEAEAAAKEAAARQEALLRAKKDKERRLAQLNLEKAEALAREKARKEELYRKRKLANKAEALRRAKAIEQCGEYITPEHLSGNKVLIEGEVIFTVDEPGSKMFGYGVLARDDGRIYFIRDPKNIVSSKISDTISWELKTMGRTEALAKSSEEVYAYDKKSKTKYTMALLMKECVIK